MKTIPYLGFDGNCAEAFRFCADVLRGELRAIVRNGDAPGAEEMPADWHPRVMHAWLVADQVELMGGDSPPGEPHRPSGFCVSLQVDSAEEAERLWAALVDGGEVTMPMEPTFWAERFGMLFDRFGIPWMVNYQGAVAFQAPAPGAEEVAR